MLREVFGFDFPEVAEAVGRSEAACRQLASRARRHMRQGRPRYAADRRQRTELADRFFAALHDGDVDRLTELLAAEVVTLNDGGGHGGGQGGAFAAVQAARFLVAAVTPLLGIGARSKGRSSTASPGRSCATPPATSSAPGRWRSLDGRIEAIHSVTNPEKLRHLGPVGDLRAVLRERNRARRSPG